MEGLLSQVSTSYTTRTDALVEAVQDVEAKPAVPKTPSAQVSLPEEALETLKSEPNYESLIATLSFLTKATSKFNIHEPGPIASQLIQVLVSETIPTFWHVFKAPDKGVLQTYNSHTKGDVRVLIDCLRSVPALSSITLNLKQHIQISKINSKQHDGQPTYERLKILLEVLNAILEGPDFIQTVWKNLQRTSSATTRKALWTEFLSLTGGKLLSIAAEGETIVESVNKGITKRLQITDGTENAKWIAQNICTWAKDLTSNDDDSWRACSEIFSRSFRLGYTENIVQEILTNLLLYQDAQPQCLLRLLDRLLDYEQQNFLLSLLKFVAKRFLSSETIIIADSNWWTSDREDVAAVAKLTKVFLDNHEMRRNHIIAWLTSSSGAGIGESASLRRAVITAVAADKNDIETVLEKSLRQFGDQLYIKHVPSMQQEVHAQVLLLSAGHVHRKSPMHFKMLIRAGGHLSVVSNRLGASSTRARFLGMVIAEALSGLVDEGDKRMDFKMDEMETPEALWYKSLVYVEDSVGSLTLLQISQIQPVTQQPKVRLSSEKRSKRTRAKPQNTKIIAIEEISDDDDSLNTDSDNDGLTPYAKPDSDADDSDDDPTLITRNRPTAPVYVRDLILYLRDGENYDKQKLGLATAAPLIRRKANFGTEVSEHAEEVAALLVGIQDKYEIDDFDRLRLSGMIALIIALPQKMGQWFAKTFFDGDYSLAQRASILTTLGLSARELGGYGSDDPLSSEDTVPFPSKVLPEGSRKRFTPLPAATSSSALKPIENLTQQLQNTYLAPLATSIADKSTGPDILKLKTFSSRIKSQPRPPKKIITNNLATIISSSFFFPLTGRFFVHLKAYGASKSSNIIFQPHLLAHFLKTLAVLLHASGPSTLALPQMTIEFWDLLLSLRTQAVGDVAVLEALLFSCLTILEINENKRSLVEENGGRLLETQSWVEGVFSRLQGSGEEEGRIKMCAAGILVRIREVVERYQALLMGDLARFEG